MNIKNISSSFLKSLTYSTAIILVGLLAYSATLIIGIPDVLTQLFLSDNLSYLFIASTAILYFAYRPSGWLGTFTSFTTTLVLFASQLSAGWLWRSAYDGFGWNKVLSISFIPWGDAAHYFPGALSLLAGNTLNTLSSWRPLAHGVTATLLGLTQQNLQVTLAILVLITAISVFFLAREVQRTHGTMAGVLVLITTFMFYRPYIGTVLTENLGLALGSVGLASLWRGTANRHMNFCLLGIFLFTLALNARAGAFFILPAFVLWGTWLFRGSSHFSWRFFLGGFSVVFLGFLINSLVSKVIGDPNAMANSNFAYVFYGLVVGGDWTTVYTDYPEIKNFSNLQASKIVYQLAFEKLRANPFALLINSLQTWKQFLFKVNIALQILIVIGLIYYYRQRKTAIGSLMIVSAIAILLSVPFLRDGGIRPYAATIPLMALFPVLGLVSVARKMKWSPLLQVPQSIEKSNKVLAFFCISLALFTFLGPIGTKILSKPPQFTEISCPPGMESAYFHIGTGSSIHIVNDSAISRTYIPNVRISDFKKAMYSFNDNFGFIKQQIHETTEELVKLKPNTTLIMTINLKTNHYIWAIVNTDKIPKESGIIAACGKRTENKTENLSVINIPGWDWSYLDLLFYADSVTLVSR